MTETDRINDDPNSPGHGWVKRSVMADIFNVSLTHFDRHLARYARTDHKQRVGKTVYFYARGLLNEWVKADTPTRRTCRHCGGTGCTPRL